MKILLHTCCAVCAIIPRADIIQKYDNEPFLFFFNPNIHPYKEFRKRIGALKEIASINNCEKKIILDEDYRIENYLQKIINRPAGTDRCKICYEIRMEKTAQYAAENNFSAFSTTLLFSPYQNHAVIHQVCAALEEKYSVNFLKEDWRPHYNVGIEKAKSAGIYMQSYCGCIFSEEERFRNSAMKKRRNELNSIYKTDTNN